MTKFFMTTAAAMAAFAMAPSANATVMANFTPSATPGDAADIANTGQNGVFNVSGNIFSGPITAIIGHTISVLDDFIDTYTFTIPQTGNGSGAVINIEAVFQGDIDFTSVVFNNGVSDYFGTVTNVAGGDSKATVSGVPIISGNLNTVTVTGKVVTAPASYGGNLSFTPVPEPTTWAMMLVGFGLVGFALRRRQSVKTAVSFA